MIARARSPIWLAQPSRFARLTPLQAAVAAAIIAFALLLSLLAPVPLSLGPIADQIDIGFQDAVIEGIRAGGDYYGVVAQALRANDYPLRPFLAFRLPALTMVQSALPDLSSQLLAGFLAAAVLLAWGRRIAGWFPQTGPRIAALVALVGGMAAVARPELVHVHELWVALLIAWSLAIRRDDRWIEAVALGLIAMLLRETAALYAVAMMVVALTEGRRREAIGWGAALAVLGAALALHARAAGLVGGPPGAGVPPAGLMGGIPLFTAAIGQSGVLAMMPAWVGQSLAVLALAGWFAGPGPVAMRAALTFTVFALAVAVLGRADSVSWVLAIAPAYFVGLAFLPDAIRDAGRAILDRPRVRVHRITR